jgi:D-amino-acid dehydrogenase
VAELAGGAFDRLAARGTDFELHRDGLIYPAFHPAEVAQLVRAADDLRAAGSRAPLDRLGAADLHQLEPALAENLAGGLFARDEIRVRPEQLAAGLVRTLSARGVQVREGAGVRALTARRGRWRVDTATEQLEAETLVLACGTAVGELTAPLGIKLALAAAKGYSRTYRSGATAPRRALYLERQRVAVSAFDGGVRVSGTLELAARDLSLSDRRLEAIAAAAQAAFPRWQMAPDPQDWAGMRVLTPDGLPMMGEIRRGLYVLPGHATLGITLAPIGAELLADLMLDGYRSPLLAPFDPLR